MSDKKFVHLHLHTHYSLLDGALKIEELAEECASKGYPAVAITDHGNMFGAVEFYKKISSAGVKPIIGYEAYLAPRTMKDKDPKIDSQKNIRHLVLLVENETGYKNLMKLSSEAFLTGFYYKPRIDKDILEKHSDGLIAMTACIHGEVPELLRAGRYEDALKAAGWYRDVFGKDRFFIELQDHGLEDERRIMKDMVKIARDLGVKVVATNDVHYLRREDSKIQELLLKIQTRKDEGEGLEFEGSEFYLKSPDEMWQLFGEIPESLCSTLEIAERVDFQMDFSKFYLPRYDIPEAFVYELERNLGRTPSREELVDEFLKKEAFSGLEKRLGGKIPDNYAERLSYELDMIKRMGFSEYFLIVADFVNQAREKGIFVGPGRGSAAGALVSYALGITGVDPVKHDLLFERFLNPERVTMPDIDVDFEDARRDEVLDYLKNRYGEDHTASIITFNIFKPRSAVQEVARVLGVKEYTGKNEKIDPSEPLASQLEHNPFLKEMLKNDTSKQVLDYAMRIEGYARHVGKHASGVVVSSVPLDQVIPLYYDQKEEKVITQYEGVWLEEVGLIKMDVLGLRNLTVIKEALEKIKERYGVDINLDDLDFSDPEVYRLISKGDTTGVFQLESSGMRKMLRDMKPSSFSDIVSALALYRPGPLNSGMAQDFIDRKHGRVKIDYPFPELKDVLSETYGVIVYQEQVMKIAQIIAGFSLGEADNLRRAMGKKKKEIMEKMREKFVKQAVERGYDRRKVEELYSAIEKFARYGFNKSHSTGYAVLTYQTAWLRTHYYLEFMTSLMDNDSDDTDKLYQYVIDCWGKGVEVLPPDINRSRERFTIEGEAIRYSLSAVKGLGEGIVRQIVEEREKNGDFISFKDFLKRMAGRIKKNQVEVLIKCGAFDSLGEKRGALYRVYETEMDRMQRIAENEAKGQGDLFMGEGGKHNEDFGYKSRIKGDDWPSELKSFNEKDTIGFHLSSFPWDGFVDELICFSNLSAVGMRKLDDNQKVFFWGFVKEVRDIKTRGGKSFIGLNILTLKGDAFVIASKKSVVGFVDSGKIVFVMGKKVSNIDFGVKVVADSVIEWKRNGRVFADNPTSVFVLLDRNRVDDEFLNAFDKVLRENSGGGGTVFVGLEDIDGNFRKIVLNGRYLVKLSKKLVRDILGLGGVEIWVV